MLAMGELLEGEKTAGKPFLSHPVRPKGKPPGMEARHCAILPALSFSTLSFVIDTDIL